MSRTKQRVSPRSSQSKKAFLVAFFLFANSVGAWAQDTAVSFLDDPATKALLPLYLITAVVFVVLILTLVAAVVALRVINSLVEQSAREKAAQLGVVYVQPLSTWEKLWENINAMRPIEEEKDLEMNHNYDGIRELDNHLPPWWKGLFYGCVVFAVIYMIVYHVGGSMPLSGAEYEAEVAEANERARIWRASQPAEVIDQNTLVYAVDAPFIGNGKKLFMSNNCQSCHRNDGGGNSIGPNLTDEYWLHGGDIKNVFSTINNGVVEKAMPAWGKVMSQKDVRDLAFYVMSLQGTKPENAKKPQGELVKPTVTAPKDSTKISMIN
jgi:cytochrome c oxidase cbb3-type subunit 3